MLLNLLNKAARWFDLKVFVAHEDARWDRVEGVQKEKVVHVVAFNWFPFGPRFWGLGGQVQITSQSVGYTINNGEITFVSLDWFHGNKISNQSWPAIEPERTLFGHPHSEAMQQLAQEIKDHFQECPICHTDLHRGDHEHCVFIYRGEFGSEDRGGFTGTYWDQDELWVNKCPDCGLLMNVGDHSDCIPF